MFTKKIGFIFTLGLILLFSIVSIAQAAPPLQEPEEDGTTTSTGDSFNLKEDGENLGCIMSGHCASDDSPDECPEGEDCTPPEECAEGEDCTPPEECAEGEDCTPPEECPEGEDCTPPDECPEGEECDGGEKQHPVAFALSEHFGVDYAEIKDLHDSGVGFGVIVKWYYFADKFSELGIDPTDLLDSQIKGWANILKEYGFHPSGKDKGNLEGAGGPPGQLKKGNNNDGLSTLSGPGGGKGNNGNGQGKGNKGGNGKGVSGKPGDKPEGGQGNGNKGGNGGGNGKGQGKNK